MLKQHYVYWLLLSCFLLGVSQLLSADPARHEKSPKAQIGLDFPYAQPEVLSYVKCFGLTQWDPQGEIHGGIDLIPEFDLNYSEVTPIRDRLVELVAPTAGRVAMVRPHLSTDSGFEKNLDIMLIIEITPRWYVALNIEPKIDTSKALSWVNQQAKLIKVKEGQHVKRGARLGYLVVGGKGDKYPHVHYSLLYRRVPEVPNTTYPEVTLETILEHARYQYPRDIVLSNPRAPWDNVALDQTIPAAFLCPYDFSTVSARAVFDNIPKHDLTGMQCTCVCLRESINGNCGECMPPSASPTKPPSRLRIIE